MSVWGVLGVIGRAAVEMLATPTAFVVLLTLIVVGAGALYLLQRMLGTEEG